MPIITQDYSAHKDVVFMEFGTGDIMFTKGRPEGSECDDRLLFSNQNPPRQIGDETSEHVGKSSDDLDNVKVVMIFNKPESITALIHSLIELQKSIFKKQSCA
jgi:hypothetical protein